MRKLLVPLLAAFALTTAVNAESYWLVISAASQASASLQKIEMSSMYQCEEQGKIFRKATYIKRNVQYICLKGK